jgi:hypothetical protein
MSEAIPVYLFRSGRFARNGDTVVSAAPLDVVMSVYGGGGLFGEGGIKSAFGGAAFYHDDEATSACGALGMHRAFEQLFGMRVSGSRSCTERLPLA